MGSWTRSRSLFCQAMADPLVAERDSRDRLARGLARCERIGSGLRLASAEIRGCAILGADGVLAASGDGERWGDAAQALLDAADRAAGATATHAHVATEEGEVFVVRSGRARDGRRDASRFTLASLVFADMRAALRARASRRRRQRPRRPPDAKAAPPGPRPHVRATPTRPPPTCAAAASPESRSPASTPRAEAEPTHSAETEAGPRALPGRGAPDRHRALSASGADVVFVVELGVRLEVVDFLVRVDLVVAVLGARRLDRVARDGVVARLERLDGLLERVLVDRHVVGDVDPVGSRDRRG